MILPTPPGTSHRDKENRFGTRVVWSPHNQYHTLTTTIPPPKASFMASASKHLPTKSILKKSLTVLQPILEENQREITPEPSDPLTDMNYLESPVAIIIASDSSLRQLIESYSVLAARLKSSVTGTTDADASWPIFQPMRKHRDAIVQSFIRDLGRALVEPATKGSIAEECCGKDITILPSPKDSPRKKQGMTAEQVKYARDLCTTCHAVMKLLATVFTLPAIYKVFDDEQLSGVLTQVLAIPMAAELPTPNARKTWALSIWLLQVQRLPSEILVPAADRIAYALKRGIEGQLGKEGKKGAASDGLKAIHDLAIYQPSTFIPAFAKIIPPILFSLLDPSLSLRSQACNALGGIVLGCTSLPFSPAHVRISSCVSTFITATPAQSRNPRITPQDPAIIRTLRTTLSATDPQHAAQGPVWALCVLANFITLMGPALCMDVALTRIVSALLILSMRHKKSSVRGLGCLVWRCVAWVYFLPRLLEFNEDGKDLHLIGEKSIEEAIGGIQAGVKQWEEGRENYWKLVKSVVDMGVGVATVAGLLQVGIARDDSLKRTMSLIKVMIKRGGQTCGDAMEMVKRFVTFDAPEVEIDNSKFLPPALFSSIPGLLTVEYRSLVSAVRPIFDKCPQLEDVRTLTREEVAQDWVFEALVEIWQEGLTCLEMPDDVETPTEIVGIWEGLLKAKVAVLQDAGDSDGISHFAMRTVVIIIAVLKDLDLDLTAKAECPRASPQVPIVPVPRSNAALKLSVARDLWSITRAIIPNSLLGMAGEKLLTTLVRSEPELIGEIDDQGNARIQWSNFCAEILLTCGVDEMTSFWAIEVEGRKKRDWTPTVCRLVWGSLVEKWTTNGPRNWEGAAVLLGVPFADETAWDLNGDDFDSWDKLLVHTINQALDYGFDSASVLDHVTNIIARYHNPTLSPSSRIADLLISHLEMLDVRQTPGALLDFVNDVLLSDYPPEPRNKVTSMWMIRSLIRVIDTCPVEMMRDLLEKVQNGVSLWVSDECKALTQDEYIFDILPLYETSLLGIRTITQDAGTLTSFSHIIVSAFFGRDDKPASVSEAFIEFWNSTCSAEEPQNGWPPEIQVCLRSAFGLPVADETSGGVNGTRDTKPASGMSSERENGTGKQKVARGWLYDVYDDMVGEGVSSGCPALLNPVQFGDSTERQGDSNSYLGGIIPSLFASYPLGSEGIHIQRETHQSTFFSPTRERTLPSASHRTPRTPHTPRPFRSITVRSPTTPTTCSPHTPVMSNHKALAHFACTKPNKHMSLENKENISPHASPLGTIMTGARSSVLGKRRALDSSVADNVSKRAKKGGPMACAQSDDSVGFCLQKATKALSPQSAVQPLRNTSTPQSEGSEGLNMLIQDPPALLRKRKAIFMEAVEVLTVREVRRRRRQHGENPDRLSPFVPILQPTASATIFLGGTTPSEDCEPDSSGIQRTRSESCEFKCAIGAASSPPTSVKEYGSDDSIYNKSPYQVPKDSSSDDDPYDGQVTPHRLISPALRRSRRIDDDPPSDDSNISASPSREVVARRLERVKSFLKLSGSEYLRYQ